ncbi:MAG: NAD(P)-dependent alcohol dehydrogenase [Desulfobacterales bacterium]
MKIKAAVSPQTGKPFEIQEVDLEEPRPNEVLVRIVGTGLCHTDLLFKDHMPIPLPAVWGHEGAGIVEKTGEAVTSVKPGDPVAISYNSCGKCNNCMCGMPYYCLNFIGLNYSGARLDGTMPISKDGSPVFGMFFGQSSFAEFSLTTERNIVKAPPDVPVELLGPLGCGVQTGAGTVLNALRVQAGSSIAVFGTGAVGLSAVMMARAVGCTCIIGVDIKEERLKAAQELGATHVINPKEKNPVEQIQAITGMGVDYSIETTAVPSVYRQALESLNMTGECVLLGAPPLGTEVTFDMQSFLTGKKTRGVIEGDSIPQIIIPQLLDLYKQGKFPFDKMITYYDAKDINQAVEDSEKGVAIKPVIRFDH